MMDNKKKSLLTKSYKQFLDAALGIEGLLLIPKIVDKEVTGFGTSVDEKTKDISDLKTFLRKQIKLRNNESVKWKFKPFTRYITADENTAVFADDLQLNIKAGKGLKKMNLRFSVMLNYTDDKWKIIHWHSSKPVQVPGEEGTDGIKSLQQKNAKLEKLVKQKTADLKVKKRELEIESSLERVRMVAMGMKKSDDLLSICEILFKELQALGFTALRNTLIHIYVDEKKYFVDYDFSDFIGAKISYVPYKSLPFIEKYLVEIRTSKDSFTEIEIVGKELEEWRDFRNSSGQLEDPRLDSALALYYYNYSFGDGDIGISTFHPIVHEKREILKRFRNVFDLAYRRYMDIQQAEAQTREAEIELALERVRARTMAMQKSDELPDAANLLFQQVETLGMPTWSAGYCIWDEDMKAITLSMSRPWGDIQPPFRVPLDEDPSFIHFLEAHKRSEELFIEEISGEALVQNYKYLRTLPVVGEQLDTIINEGHSLPTYQVNHCAYFSKGFLLFITYQKVAEGHVIFKRFASVFDQTYTRFLDLQNAEAQAREAQIQLALERVRARTMAMQKSEELANVATVLFQQVKALGVPQWVCGFCIWNIGDTECKWYPGSPDGEILTPGRFPLTGHQVFRIMDESRKRGDELYILEKGGELQKDHYRYMKTLPGVGQLLQDILDAGYTIPDFQIDHYANFAYGNLIFITYKHFPEMHVIFKRFAKVFEQTYTRFLDLQKAEAQAREAQIEAALERVRSRTMAMQKSEELKDVINLVYEQCIHLNINVEHAGFLIDYKTRDDLHIWLADEHLAPSEVKFPWFDCPPNNAIRDAKEKGEDFFFYHLNFEEKNKFYRDLFKLIPGVPDETINYYLQCPGLAGSGVLLESIGLYIENFSGSPYTDEENAMLMRFGKVFQQTYTRFLDLQKAEAQAREAQIETALERVRASTMAMQKSEDLAKTAVVLFDQLKLLGDAPDRMSIGVINEPEGLADMWLTDQEGQLIDTRYILDLEEKTVVQKLVKGWKSGLKSMTVDLQGEEFELWLKYVRSTGLIVRDEHFKNRRVHNVAFFNYGWLNISSLEPVSSEMINILERFAAVYNLTYTRFLDLQKAEANAREAIKQAALDRIRADIASMRTISDLDRITPLIWNELTTLSVPFIRCGVFIMDETQQLINTFLSTPDGKAIAAFHLPFDTPGNIRKILTNWKSGTKYIDHWDQLAFNEMADILVKQGAISASDQYLDAIPYGGFYLHFLPFLQGMLYVGNTLLLSEEEIELIQHLADAFSTAYARYEDFNKLEAAKKQVDSTLTELQATQKQLIQSEKMASLGELTAGIAHEIQNPLNFVNNFSEVSAELLGEMKEAIEKGDIGDAKEIMNDVIQNLEKINHHGKRADGIVKGMLQHSRSSSGQKEMTNINTLCDEYLRLAYHGLRAKDKSFSAKFETDFDNSIGKINIVQQEIGRVILNLINNAFYAVNEKAKSLKKNSEGFEPTVIVSTKNIGDKIEVRVKDNGSGIPEKVKDKIFQPFFTTKPTGSGTGLGLSLSYDIVKAHDGEIKVESKEGEGTQFVIQLPVV